MTRRRYQLVLLTSMVLLGAFLAAVSVHAWRAEYARQVQLQTSRIAGIGARVEEIADVARARVVALRQTTALSYATLRDDSATAVPTVRDAPFTQLIRTPGQPTEHAEEGNILAHPLRFAGARSQALQAWREDFQVFRSLWLSQAGLHAASKHVALSYVVSARTGATANYPSLPPQALSAMLDRKRPVHWNPVQTPFLNRLAPEALPDRALVWLPVYLDRAAAVTRVDASVKGDGRVISLIAPVDVDGRYRAGVGIDLWAEEIARILRSADTAGTELTLVDGSGLVIATTRPGAQLTAARLGMAEGSTRAAKLLGVEAALLAQNGAVASLSRLFYLWPVPNTPFRLVGELRPAALRRATLSNVGPLIAGALLLYVLLALALWYVVQRVIEPAFALAGHIQSLGESAPPKLPGYWARVLAVTQSAFVERRRFEAELAAQREALHQSEKLTALGSLLAGVAHELNNPLSVVVGRSAILAETLADSPHARGIGKLRDAADRCSRIVKTFLAMARQSGPRRTAVDINELIESALDVAAYGLRTAGVTIDLKLAVDLPLTEADGDQIVQILINLIVNAQHALETAPPGCDRRLTIATRHEASVIDVIIADTGPGVPPAVASRIFEPFFTTKQVGQGTGMGLAVSRGMAEAQGATLTLLPTEVGACFRLRLPLLRPAKVAEATATPPPPAASTSLRLLVVDDEADVAELLRDSLDDLFAVADVCSNTADAMAAIGANQYDLVISDVRMPGMSGPGLHAAAAEIQPALADRFLFISGDVLQRDALRATMPAGTPVLEKPFDPDELRAFVEDFLRERNAA